MGGSSGGYGIPGVGGQPGTDVPGSSSSGIGAAVAGGSLGVLGSALSANSGKAQLVPTPPPAPLYGGVNQQYLSSLTSSGIIPQSFNTLTSMAATGNPTDVGPAFDALKASMQHGVQEGQTNLNEQLGSHGLGSSSTQALADADYSSQTQTNFANILAQYTMASQESAAQRQLQAATAGNSLAANPALTTAPTAALVTGQPSTGGAAASSAGSALLSLLPLLAGA